MPTANASPAHRWLRLLLVVTTLSSAAFGQYWLSIRHVPLWSALAWSATAVSFLLLYALARDGRELPVTRGADLPRSVEWVLFALVFAVGVFFKLYRLREFPPGLNHDAAWEGQYAVAILKGIPYTPYVSAAWGRETMTFYFQAVCIWLLGRTQLALQVPAVIAGIVILPFMYWWVRTMFGSRAALVGMLLLGVSGWDLVFSRTGWRSDLQPLFTTITCCFFMRGMLSGAKLDFALSGMAMAATVNTYNAARAFPIIFPVWVFAVVVVLRTWHWRGFLRRYGIGLAVLAGSFATCIAPLAWYAIHNWVKFQGRANYLIGSHSILDNVKKTLLMFHYWANGDDFFLNTPGLEYFTAVFLVFGLLWCLMRWRDERSLFVLVGLAVGVLPGVISNPNMNRNIGAMPFVFAIAALGVVFFARELGRLIPRAGHVLAAVYVGAVGVASSYATYAQYLGPHAREVWGYYPETTILGQYLATLMSSYRVWVGGANFPRDTLTYFTYNGGDPFTPDYTWLDDVTVLLRANQPAPGAKGLAFVLANEGPGIYVLGELQRRYPEHRLVDLRYPAGTGQVFARAVLVPPLGGAAPESQARVPGVEPALVEAAPPEGAAPEMQAPPGQLREPRGVAIGVDGTIIVCDFGHHRIEQFDHRLSFVRQWGEAGDAPGQFKQPCGVAVGPAGEIFVADTWNHRIQVFSKNGEYLRQWVAGFFSPRGIAVDASGSVYVADSGNNRVMRFSAMGDKQVEWNGGPGSGRFAEPIGITTDGAGQVYVCDNGNARLQIFTRDGAPVGVFKVSGWASQAYSEPYVTIGPKGTIWVTVPTAKEVRAYDKSGKLLRTITGTSIKGAEFTTPLGIAYDTAEKALIVSDVENRIVRIPLS